MRKYVSEMFGTFVLVFIGCGSVVISAGTLGTLGIALCFGLAVTAMAYTVGSVSGAHLNPAVTLGMLSSKRISLKDSAFYVIFQFIGAILGAMLLGYIMKNREAVPFDIATEGLGQNGWGIGYGQGFGLAAAATFEFFATYIFVRVILKSTKTEPSHAGLVIGLTLAILLIIGMPITGGSLNPARSFGPAYFVGGEALSQIWLFLLMPSLGGIAAGLASRFYCDKE